MKSSPRDNSPAAAGLLDSPLSQRALDFIEDVMRAQPRLATFDCDGTLWDGDAGEGFFDWEIRQGVVSEEAGRRARARYADYTAGKVSEDDMCGEMVTIHQGLLESEVRTLAAQFFEERFLSKIFPEMFQLIRRLQAAGCEVWAVSSTNEWVIAEAMKYFGIAPQNILAGCVHIEGGRVTNRLRYLPSGPGKPAAIHRSVHRIPDAAFGNSRWDADMLSMVRHAFAINPNPDLEKIALEKGWKIYFPKASSSIP